MPPAERRNSSRDRLVAKNSKRGKKTLQLICFDVLTEWYFGCTLTAVKPSRRGIPCCPDCDCAQPVSDLALTYRDTASYELAAVRGSPNFIMHISRLADIENRNVVPGLHKFYTLAALYHLNPLELFRWFEIPIEECFRGIFLQG